MTAAAEDDPQVQLVIFDCDGVLVDSEPIAARVTSEALTALGWAVSAEEVHRRFVGCSDKYFVTEVRRNVGVRLPLSWFAELDAAVATALSRELRAVPGVEAVVRGLHGAGDVLTCVASNGPRAKIHSSLRTTGLLELFDGRIFSAADVRRGKPAPDLFLHAAASLGVRPARALVIEDSPRGVEAALAAGMRVLWYGGPGSDAPEVRGMIPFTRMGELPELISSVRRG